MSLCLGVSVLEAVLILLAVFRQCLWVSSGVHPRAAADLLMFVCEACASRSPVDRAFNCSLRMQKPSEFDASMQGALNPNPEDKRLRRGFLRHEATWIRFWPHVQDITREMS